MKPITKLQREVITAHLIDPKRVTQADVIRRLKLGSSNNFYRLVYRCVREK
ncbi:hypothetical protein [Tsuneonella sp. HG222]